MSKKILLVSLALIVTLPSTSLVANAQGNGRGNRPDEVGGGWMASTASLTPPTDEVIAAMNAGIQDEYNAYLAYQQITAEFGNVRPFSAIQRAEAQHIRAWERMFDRYNLTPPPMPDSVTLPDFANLTEACEFAAQAEINNLSLYEAMQATFADYPDLARVAQQLGNASEFNHLPAFQACMGQ